MHNLPASGLHHGHRRSLLAIGVALPVFILRELQLRPQRRWQQQQGQQLQAAVRLPWEQSLRLPRPLLLYLLSSALWLAVLAALSLSGQLQQLPLR